MNRNVLHTGRCGTSVVPGMAGLVLMALSAWGQLSLTNSTSIRINDDANSTPYQNSIVVSGATGTVEKVTVTLNGLSHGYVHDVAVLLVGPIGTAADSVILMSSAGGNQAANALNVTFDDSGATLPQLSGLTSTTYAPANYFGTSPNPPFTGPAPLGTYATSLSALAGGSPNGTWSLYVLDDFPLNDGVILSWTLNLTPSLAFLAPQAISIPPGLFPGSQPSAGTATPYPSTNTVSGLSGLVSGVTVTLVGFNHAFPQDVDVLLVKKNVAVVLMSHAGGGYPANKLRLTFSDGAANAVPFNTQLTSTSYRPAAWPGNSFTQAGPPFSGSFTTNLSSFNGTDPNGDWLLYVVDDTYPTGGSIGSGWILSLQTAPVIPPVRPTLHFALVGKVFNITFAGVPNASYVIQSSSDLKNWTAVGPAIAADSNGKVEYDAAVNSSRQYFRALFQ